MSNFVHQRDPSTFTAPDTFRPERWLEADLHQLLKQTEAFTPFSIGPRNCIGQKYGFFIFAISVSDI